MKRIILSLTAILLLSSPAVYSQANVRVDKTGLLRKIENSNEDIANPKKADKIATWLNRGRLFTDAATEISKNISEKMSRVAVDLMLGRATEETAVLNGIQYKKLTYPIMVVYVDEFDLVRAWEIDEVVYEGALEEAVAAYDKAYQLDTGKKNVDKINDGFQAVFDEYYKDGGNMYALGEFEKSGEAFENALKLVDYPGYTKPDDKLTLSLSHDTGLAYYFAKNFPKAIEYFTKAEELGYERDGDIYTLLYNAYRGLANDDLEVLRQVEPILDRGFIKYPDNAGVIEVITDLYVKTGKDTNDLIPIVEEAVANDPQNPVLWNGLGRIHERLGNLDQSITAFERVSELTPNSYNAFTNQGILYIRKADSMIEEVNKKTFSGQAEYDAAKKDAFDVYKKAIVVLERAHELNPAERMPLDLLKRVTFILRAEPEMAAKMEKYTALLNAMQ